MKSKAVVFLLATVIIGALSAWPFPTLTQAAVIFDTTGVIEGEDYSIHDFVADKGPYTYRVELADLGDGTFFSFAALGLILSTSTDVIDALLPSNKGGSFAYHAKPGTKYSALVFGEGDGSFKSAGYYGLTVSAVPIPASAYFLASGVLTFLFVTRKKHK
jgi:hypothetical protein